ncbi:signal peptidase II [bacterium]|nr:signal peptidase II [bacterium]
MSRRSAWFWFWGTALVGLIADLGSKSAVFAWLGFPSEQVAVVIPGWLQFVTRLNNGGIWSIGAEYGLQMNSLLIGFCSVASVLILIWAYFGIRPRERVFPLVLGAIMAGAMGNLHDRIFFEGVRDFIEFHYFDIWYYPTFNLADSFLVCGAAYLVISSLLWGDRTMTSAAISSHASL